MATPDIRQGDVYWVEDDEPFGSEPGFRRPWLVVQNNLINASPINTVIACPLTSNLRHARAPGNVLLARGEAGLPSTSVVQVLGLTALDRMRFEKFQGVIRAGRLAEVLTGISTVLEPREP